jgi:hypothetical protein
MGPFTIGHDHDGLDDGKSFRFTFRANEPARIVVRNRSGAQLKLEAYEIDDSDSGSPYVYEHTQRVEGTSNPELKWRPDRTAKWDVGVSNNSDFDAEIDLFKN